MTGDLSITLIYEKKLESAHHKFQGRIMGISWKDKVGNERVRAQLQLEKIDLIIKERRLRWLGHVLRMDDKKDCQDKLGYKRYTKRKSGRSRKNWIDTIQQHLKSIGMTWEVA